MTASRCSSALKAPDGIPRPQETRMMGTHGQRTASPCRLVTGGRSVDARNAFNLPGGCRGFLRGYRCRGHCELQTRPASRSPVQPRHASCPWGQTPPWGRDSPVGTDTATFSLTKMAGRLLSPLGRFNFISPSLGPDGREFNPFSARCGSVRRGRHGTAARGGEVRNPEIVKPWRSLPGVGPPPTARRWPGGRRRIAWKKVRAPNCQRV